jgi:lipopolysaccharide/colanic/teichoic acid biosynthesis glycosyltransferase
MSNLLQRLHSASNPATLDSLPIESFGDSLALVVPSRSRDEALSCLIRKPIPIWKRTFDIFVSLAMLLVLSPLLIAIAVFIRCVSKGPILFKQMRMGEMGRDFEILKFRTLRPMDSATADHQQFMSQLTTGNQAMQKPNLAKRLIPGGKFLRGWSLDELPQLFNVLRGEMSLIGPRPDVLAWSHYENWQLKRFETLPGLTGLWQVSGKNRLTFHEMIKLDIQYVERRSIGLDFWIMLKTARVLFSKDNA